MADIAIIMNLNTLRAQYRSAILAIAARHKAENVRIFGSVARGDARADSDVDILVHTLQHCSLLDLCKMQNEISDLMGGVAVDLLVKDEIRPELVTSI